MIKGFAPLIDEECSILILGSMPSVTSLAVSEYYGHPQNRFWKMMSVLLEGSIENYEAKKELLLANHIALWDVIDSCERDGSLDSAIENVIENDIVVFLKEYSRIDTILCNGRKAYDTLIRKWPSLKEKAIYLPSTSPANAGCSFERLVNTWGEYIRKR